MANSLEIIRLSEVEMLNLWKLKLQLLPVHKNCVIEREDGVDVDKYLLIRIRDWYCNLLNTAPAEWLPCRDLSQELTVGVDSIGVGTVSIPSHCMRPLLWEMEGWHSPITAFHSPEESIAQLQSNRYCRAGIENPVAVLFSNEVKLYSCTGNKLSKAICTIAPEKGIYELAEVALATIDIIKKEF